MEEEILQEMIRDRESQIKMIQTKLESQGSKMERLKRELADARELYRTEHVEHTRTLEQSYARHGKLLQDLKNTIQSLDMKRQQQGTQLHVYNEVMKAIASPEARESSYVLRMQAQLCKAMHSMGMLETQLVLLTHGTNERQKYLKETLTRTVEEKSQVELTLMNDLVLADNLRRDVATKHRTMVTNFTTEKDALLEKLEKQQDEADKEADGQEKEEDDVEEKAELQEILTQGREEMKRMEAENKDQLAQLESLKAKVAAIRGENFVEELVSTIAEEFKSQDEEEDGNDDDDDDDE